MLPNDEDPNFELERLITAATPKLTAAAQHQLAYSAGMAVGRHLVQRDSDLKGGGSRWMWMVSHAVCALAASWITFAILPETHRSSPAESPSTKSSNVASMALKDPNSNVSELFEPSANGILSPRTSPSRFVEFITNRETNSMSVPNPESEPVLNSRSIIF